MTPNKHRPTAESLAHDYRWTETERQAVAAALGDVALFFAELCEPLDGDEERADGYAHEGLKMAAAELQDLAVALEAHNYQPTKTGVLKW